MISIWLTWWYHDILMTSWWYHDILMISLWYHDDIKLYSWYVDDNNLAGEEIEEGVGLVEGEGGEVK